MIERLRFPVLSASSSLVQGLTFLGIGDHHLVVLLDSFLDGILVSLITTVFDFLETVDICLGDQPEEVCRRVVLERIPLIDEGIDVLVFDDGGPHDQERARNCSRPSEG